jgi:hypothetical protein
MSLLTGHRPGAFEGFQMKDLFDKDRWDREQRTWSGQQTPTGPNDLRTNRAGEPMMTNWYKGRGTPEANVIKTRDAGGAPIYQGPQQQARVQTRALSPAPNIQSQPLSDPLSLGSGITPNRIPHLSAHPGQNTMRNLGVYNPIGADTVATEEEVEAMNAYRNQMLTDLLAETSEEPEVKAISYYKKKKRLPKTYRSQSRGYRLKRI